MRSHFRHCSKSLSKAAAFLALATLQRPRRPVRGSSNQPSVQQGIRMDCPVYVWNAAFAALPRPLVLSGGPRCVTTPTMSL